MSYYSEKKYKTKESEEMWFEKLYFDRWFKNNPGLILDIGCATGNFIATHPEIIEGIEIDDDSFNMAKSRGLRVMKIDVDKELFKLESNKYRGIYAKHIIEHLQNPLNFLKEIKRILKPGGKAIISTPNCPYMLKRGFWDDYTHQRPFTKKSLKMIAYDVGFKDVKVYEDFRCFPGLGFLMRFFHLSPELVSKIQRLFFIRGLSLILEVVK